MPHSQLWRSDQPSRWLPHQLLGCFCLCSRWILRHHIVLPGSHSPSHTPESHLQASSVYHRIIYSCTVLPADKLRLLHGGFLAGLSM